MEKEKCPMQGRMSQCKEGECHHQPIEEKCNWREEFDEKFGVFSTNVNKRPLTSKAIESFIENLLEQERKRMSDEIEKRKMDGYCKDENCSHDECGTIRWFNKALNISLSIIYPMSSF